MLSREDEDLSTIVKEQMKKEGVRFRLQVKECKDVCLSCVVNDEGFEEN